MEIWWVRTKARKARDTALRNLYKFLWKDVVTRAVTYALCNDSARQVIVAGMNQH